MKLWRRKHHKYCP